MQFMFSGSGRVLTAGSMAINALNFTGQPVPNNTRFVFRWNGQIEELIAKTTPQGINEIPAGNGSPAYVASLLDFFTEYFPFREDFSVSLDSINGAASLIFVANKPGPQYNFKAVAVPANVGNIDPRFVASPPQYRERYSIYVELFLQNAGTVGALASDYKRIYRSSLETDEQGLTTFDAGDLLHANLKADWPDWDSPQPMSGLDSHRRYYIAYGESWGNPLKVGRITKDIVRHAYLGGADYKNRSGNGFNLHQFVLGISPPEDHALRLGKTTRYVRSNEPQFLTFLNARPPVSAWLRIRLTFDDGTGLTLTNIVPTMPMVLGDKWTVAAGATQLGLITQVPAGRFLKEYTIRLSQQGTDPDGNNHLSVEYRYILNYDYQPYTRYFAYLSSLGCPETLATFGKGSNELNRFYEQAQHYQAAHYELSDGQFVDYNVSTQRQVEVATGFRSAAELSGWNDFYRSPIRFRINPVPGVPTVALPVGIVSKSIKQAKDGEHLFAHKFEYQYLFRDDFHTPTPDDLVGEDNPPANFAPAGSVTVTQPMLLRSVDDTIPAFIRGLTAGDISKFKMTAARPNPETLGYLRQADSDGLYYRQDQGIDYQQSIVNKPTTRDAAGLTDVPTFAELPATVGTPSLDKVLTQGGNVSGAPMKTGGYGRPSFTPVSNPHGLGAVVKLSEDDYYIEEIDAGNTRQYLSVPRFDLATVQNGQVFVTRKLANGAVEMIPVARDSLQSVAERGADYSGQLGCDLISLFSELPRIDYASHLVSTYYNEQQQRWVFVKINLPKLASDLIGLMSGQTLATRILPFLPGINQNTVLVYIEDTRCQQVDVVAPSTPIIRPPYVLTGQANGSTFTHNFGAIEFLQTAYGPTGRYYDGAWLTPLTPPDPNKSLFNGPAGGFTGTIKLETKP